MRAEKIIFALLAVGSSLSAIAQGAADLVNRLLETNQYINDAKFEVLLPSAMDPIVYDVVLQSQAAPGDTLAPCDYLIRWATETNGGSIDGFSAYFDGNHYRYRNNRLQEYHFASNPEAFIPMGANSQYRNGIHSTAQFADMLPQYLGLKIHEIITDSAYIYQFHPDTIVHSQRTKVIDGVKRGSGYDLVQFTYVFDYATDMPLLIDLENSPGSISEQLVTVTYGNGSDSHTVDISENGIIEEWPEIFEKYRQSTFRAENLVNTPMPAFACKTLSDERYTHHLNEEFDTPKIIVILDPDVATSAETVKAIREAVQTLPMQSEVLWTFATNDVDDITSIIGEVQTGENCLISANSLLRNCGITLYPTTILVDRSSKVHDVINGFNNELGLIVLQKAMLLK